MSSHQIAEHHLLPGCGGSALARTWSIGMLLDRVGQSRRPELADSAWLAIRSTDIELVSKSNIGESSRWVLDSMIIRFER